MPIIQLFIYLLVYIVPALSLFATGCIVIAKNYRKAENQLVALLVTLYSVLLVGEFLRHLLPISYSPIMYQLFFINVGMLSFSATYHFYVHITKLQERLKMPFYPYIFYLPSVMLLFLLLINRNIGSQMEFIQKGIWYVPILGLSHYIVVGITSILMLILLGILINGLKHATSNINYRLIRLLAVGTFWAFVLTILLGFVPININVPPFSNLLVGVLLAIFLSVSVFRYQLLPSITKRYQTMFDLSPVSIIVLNENWDILEFSGQAEKDIFIHGHKQSKLIDLLQFTLNQQELIRFFDLLKETQELQDYSISFHDKESKELHHYAVDASTIFIEDKSLFYTIWRNVTEELENERFIEKMAYYDSLTGLHNRAYFVAEVKVRLSKKTTTSTKQSALVLIDLDRFKSINDTYGHAVGDEVLQKTAGILLASVRQYDLVARIGGDEFILYLDDFPSEESINSWRDKLRKDFKEKQYQAAGNNIEIELSIGIAYYLTDGNDFESLYQFADAKMYEDKLLSRV